MGRFQSEFLQPVRPDPDHARLVDRRIILRNAHQLPIDRRRLERPEPFLGQDLSRQIRCVQVEGFRQVLDVTGIAQHAQLARIHPDDIRDVTGGDGDAQLLPIRISFLDPVIDDPDAEYILIELCPSVARQGFLGMYVRDLLDENTVLTCKRQRNHRVIAAQPQFIIVVTGGFILRLIVWLIVFA